MTQGGTPLPKTAAPQARGNSSFVNRQSSIVNLAAPRGVTVEHAAAMLRYSRMTILRMIADGTLVAWKPRGPRGRKWLIDEVSLGALQAAMVQSARTKAAPIQSALLQGELPLIW